MQVMPLYSLEGAEQRVIIIYCRGFQCSQPPSPQRARSSTTEPALVCIKMTCLMRLSGVSGKRSLAEWISLEACEVGYFFRLQAADRCLFSLEYAPSQNIPSSLIVRKLATQYLFMSKLFRYRQSHAFYSQHALMFVNSLADSSESTQLDH
jgi:hypothetical protein